MECVHEAGRNGDPPRASASCKLQRNRTVLEANVGSATPVPRTGVAASEMKGLQPGSYFAGDSLEISSSRPPPIAADYLPSAQMCLSLGQIGMAAPRRYQSRAILRTEESNRAARQTERSLKPE